jgi:hypothetical protein
MTDHIALFSAGPLCIAQHNGRDRRLDDDFPTFKKFNRSLVFSCDEGTLPYCFHHLP